MLSPVQIVVDTNVFLSALRSNRGASFRLVSLIGIATEFEINLSVPLVLEYEAVAKRHKQILGLTDSDIDDILDYVCAVANRHSIHFLWRPFLRDPKDDMVLELAIVAECDYIVTFNVRDFVGVEEHFRPRVISPRDLLAQIGR